MITNKWMVGHFNAHSLTLYSENWSKSEGTGALRSIV